jgi:acyl dehydratase
MDQDDRQLKPVVGKQKVFRTLEGIGKTVIQRFAKTIGDHNPLYWDEAYAEKSRYGRLTAPPTMIFELGYDLGNKIDGETGVQQGLEEWLGNPTDIQRVANEYEMIRPAYPDDIVTARREVIEVVEKEGKAGKWTFITSRVSFTNQKGELLGVNKERVACRYEGQKL